MIVFEKLTENLRLKKCLHGNILYRANDMYLGRSLDLYGEFSVAEGEIFARYIHKDMTVIDAGANIGIHTLEMSRLARVVIAIEMERQLHQMMCANVALNDRNNVVALNAAVGEAAGKLVVPGIDLNVDGNFGCLSGHGHTTGDMIRVVTIDDMNLAGCGFIKLDIEGMEREAIEGARYTIKRYMPIIYLENDRRENSAALIELLMRLGYRCHWHFPPLYRKNNFDGREENVFGGIASLNMICFPDDREFSEGVRITDKDSWWQELPVVYATPLEGPKV